MSEKAEQNAPERCSCCTCGYTWVKGQHGGHSCAQVMAVTISELEGKVARLKTAAEKAGHLIEQMAQAIGANDECGDFAAEIEASEEFAGELINMAGGQIT